MNLINHYYDMGWTVQEGRMRMALATGLCTKTILKVERGDHVSKGTKALLEQVIDKQQPVEEQHV